ncbi:MAG: hypothetical protein ACTSQY_09475 [Candidatus Odinarchaeia archaeon]
MLHYYKLIGNNGFGDTYYCIAHNIDEARNICGLNPKYESKAVGYRCSKREYESARCGYGVHIY